MSFDADALVDRRRLRRKLMLWRVLAVVAVVAAIGAAAASFGGSAMLDRRGAHVARVAVTGLIRVDRERAQLFEDIAKSSAKAVIVEIDSPGGTVTGSEAIFGELRRLAAKKPVVALVEGTAASGAYIAAMGADQIIAGRNSIIGSIGVIVQFPNFSTLLKTVGVEVEAVRSSPLKAAPSGLEPTSAEARQALQGMVDASYGWFRDLVADRRALSGDALKTVVDGRVWTGAQALELKLVDRLGDERAALAWLAEAKGIDAALPVRDWKRTKRLTDEIRLSTRVLAGLAEMLGWSPLAQALRAETAQNSALDGLLAVWHPPHAQ